MVGKMSSKYKKNVDVKSLVDENEISSVLEKFINSKINNDPSTNKIIENAILDTLLYGTGIISFNSSGGLKNEKET